MISEYEGNENVRTSKKKNEGSEPELGGCINGAGAVMEEWTQTMRLEIVVETVRYEKIGHEGKGTEIQVCDNETFS